jgi:hypothetical protein
MLRTLIGCSLIAISLNVNSENLPESDRTEYSKDFYESCLIKQRTTSISKELTEAQRSEYCQCSADKSAETVQTEELGQVLKTGSIETLKPHLEAVRRYCGEKLAKKWLSSLKK